MTKTKTPPWDVAEHLETVEDMAAYLEAALEEGDPAQGTAIPRARRIIIRNMRAFPARARMRVR